MESTLHSMRAGASFLTAENWDFTGKIPRIPEFGHSYLSWKIHKEAGITPGCWKLGSFLEFFMGILGKGSLPQPGMCSCFPCLGIPNFSSCSCSAGLGGNPFVVFGKSGIKSGKRCCREVLQPLKQGQN